MGFFKNLFETKTCDICGGEIGLLGNKKLEDGNCCRECARKLSPWFTERKHSTVEQIKKQLESREANRQEAASFHASRSCGKRMKVYMDEDAGKFMVTEEKDLEKANPDVLDFSQVTACDLKIRESKDEVYRKEKDAEGNLKNESYSPRKYRWSYDFLLTIRVNHPYIDEIPVDLSSGRIRVETGTEGSVNPPSQAERRRNGDYACCERWAYEIQQSLLHSAPKKNGSNLDTLLAEYRAAEKDYEEAKRLSDQERENRLAVSMWPLRVKLYEAHMKKMQGLINAIKTPSQEAKGGDVFALLLAQYNAAASEYLKGMAENNPDRAFLGENSKEVIVQKLIEQRSIDREGFQRAGVMEVLSKDTQMMQKLGKAETTAEKTVVCPWCGARTAAGKFCENCGGSLDS